MYALLYDNRLFINFAVSLMIRWRPSIACCAKKTNENAEPNNERAVATVAARAAASAVHRFEGCEAEAPGDATLAVDPDHFPSAGTFHSTFTSFPVYSKNSSITD